MHAYGYLWATPTTTWNSQQYFMMLKEAEIYLHMYFFICGEIVTLVELESVEMGSKKSTPTPKSVFDLRFNGNKSNK